MPVPDTEIPSPALEAQAVIDSTVPGLVVRATVRLTGSAILDGGTVWVSCSDLVFFETFAGTISPSIERACSVFGLTGAARRSLSRTVHAAWRAAVDAHTAERLARSRAETASFASRFGSALALPPVSAAR